MDEKKHGRQARMIHEVQVRALPSRCVWQLCCCLWPSMFYSRLTTLGFALRLEIADRQNIVGFPIALVVRPNDNRWHHI
jgi:hypothetical protein